MGRFEFLNAPGIKEIEALENRKILIDDFLVEKSINILWGMAGLGKTWLCFAIAKHLSSKGQDIVYIDADNGIDIIKDRGYDLVIKEMNSLLTYINADFMDDSKKEMQEVFDKLEANAHKGYENCVFILDSLSFFLGGGVYDETRIDKLVCFCKKMRKAGATVLIINHGTKKGDTMKGGGSLINALDEIWEVKKTPSIKGILNFVLTPFKCRLKVSKTAFSVDCTNCCLKSIDLASADISETEITMANTFKELLKDKALSQSQLLANAGLAKNDRVGTRVLKNLDGIYWNTKAKGKALYYEMVG